MPSNQRLAGFWDAMNANGIATWWLHYAAHLAIERWKYYENNKPWKWYPTLYPLNHATLCNAYRWFYSSINRESDTKDIYLKSVCSS